MNSNDQPTSSREDRPSEQLNQYAQQAEHAIRRLAHLTLAEPDLTPAEIEVVLSHLAETIAALPQVATQLGGALNRSHDTHHLAMDGMTATTDPNLAVDIVCHHLMELREPAVQTYRHLDAARCEAAHISATPLDGDLDTAAQLHAANRNPRPKHLQPPPASRPGRNGPTR